MSSSNLDEQYAPYLTVAEVIVNPIASLSLAFFGYGLYTVIFGLCLHSLCDRKDRPKRKLLLGWVISLFVMNTLYVVFASWTFIRQAIIFYVAAKSHRYEDFGHYLDGDALKTAHDSMLCALLALIPATADSILIHRCYVIWGNNKRILIFLLFLFLVGNGWTIADNIIIAYGTSDTSKPALLRLLRKARKVDTWNDFMLSIVNLIITSLTAARIWWITREARKLMGETTSRRYKRIIVILLESGALFPAVLIAETIVVILADYNVRGLVPIDLTSLMVLTAGMAPTLIILRSARGEAVENVEQVVSSSMHFAENNNRATKQGSECSLDLEQAAEGKGDSESGL